MPADVVGEGIAAVLRWLLMQLAWIVVDVLLGGTGYLILRLCGARRVDDAQACVLTGLGFWVLIGFGTGWLLRRSTG